MSDQPAIGSVPGGTLPAEGTPREGGKPAIYLSIPESDISDLLGLHLAGGYRRGTAGYRGVPVPPGQKLIFCRGVLNAGY
jgi:hypothetical protein